MKGKELNVEYIQKTQEEIARKVFEDIYERINDLKKDLEEAYTKLKEVSEKEVADIKEADGKYWDW